MKTRQIDRNGKQINVADVWVLQRVNFFTKEFGCSVYESEEEAKSVFDSKVKEIMKKNPAYKYELSSNCFTMRSNPSEMIIYKMSLHTTAFKFNGGE